MNRVYLGWTRVYIYIYIDTKMHMLFFLHVITIRHLISGYKNRFSQKKKKTTTMLKQCLFAIDPNEFKQQQQQN